jgi:hypothetical protein
MQDTFQHLASSNEEELQVLGGWVDRRADMAFARRWENAQVLIYKGMAHRRELNVDALILIICHELGHLYGGAPYSNYDNKLSLEGQSDYFATNRCLEVALREWNQENVEERIFMAMLDVGKFLANNRGITHPEFNTPDETIVDETNRSHPSPQCRLDTYLAGHEARPRPNCWFKIH